MLFDKPFLAGIICHQIWIRKLKRKFIKAPGLKHIW